jgi:hypothetical protein
VTRGGDGFDGLRSDQSKTAGDQYFLCHVRSLSGCL